LCVVTAHRKRGRPAVATSWDPVADWYSGWVGEAGSKHHRLLALPAVLDLLDPVAGEQILDIGAGPGVLAPPIAAAGAYYTGIDASRKLLDFARAHHAQHGRFFYGDAARLAEVPELRGRSFDAAVFLLSIQDMEPLDAVLGSAARALRPGGRTVLLMTHPCFRVPRQSGWGWDAGRRLRYRRVDRYLTALAVPMKAYGRQTGTTRSFHRPLEAYVNGLAACGLLVDCIRELPTYQAQRAGPQARAEDLANQEIPLFLGLRARKVLQRHGGGKAML
jgi:SAM-dependent methyltransferase